MFNDNNMMHDEDEENSVNNSIADDEENSAGGSVSMRVGRQMIGKNVKKKPTKKAKKTHNRKSKEPFANYIYKVMKKTRPDARISPKAMTVMNCFVTDMFDRIVDEASHLVRSNQRKVLNARDIQTAVRLILPETLAREADLEGFIAITKLNSSKRNFQPV